MKKLLTILRLAAAFVFVLGFAGNGSYAGGAASKSQSKIDSFTGVVGAYVKNPQGEDLGRVSDIVMASDRRVVFAVLSCGGLTEGDEKLVAVPFNALKLDLVANKFVLNIPKERLESAPTFDKKDIFTLKWAEDIYRYFGQQPYWTEKGEGGPDIKQPIEEKKVKDFPSGYEEMGMRFDLRLA